MARLARLKPGSAAKSPNTEARSGHDECRTPLADALVASLSDPKAERIRGGGISADLRDRYGNEQGRESYLRTFRQLLEDMGRRET